MTIYCAFTENGLFRVHLFGEAARSNVPLLDLSKALGAASQSWNLRSDSGYLDLIFRDKLQAMNDRAVY